MAVRLYLASRSPRRRELLPLIGVRFRLLDVEVDESPRRGEAPRAYVLRLAAAKARAAFSSIKRRNLKPWPVLTADTTVALGKRIFEKPADAREAAAMLRALSGRRHEVLTAVALHNGNALKKAISVSVVQFRKLSRRDIQQYVASGEWRGKAGAYAIQGQAARFVRDLRGSYTGVMGLPLFETAQLLESKSR